jgi:hypothetical protein
MPRVSMSGLSGSLPGFVSWFFVLLSVWILWRKKLISFAKRLGWMSSLPKVTVEIKEARAFMRRHTRPKGFARLWAVFFTFVLILSWSLWGVTALSNQRHINKLESELAQYRASTVMQHHVTILRETEDGDFAFISDEAPEGDSYRPCPEDKANGVDTPSILRQAIGYTADWAKWEERGTCKSILRADLKFNFRDLNNNFTYQGGR